MSAGQVAPPTPPKVIEILFIFDSIFMQSTIDRIGLLPWKPGSLQYIIHTRVGPGPMTI